MKQPSVVGIFTLDCSRIRVIVLVHRHKWNPTIARDLTEGSEWTPGSHKPGVHSLFGAQWRRGEVAEET